MLRYEIKEFLLNIGSAEQHNVTVPFTLHSAMCDIGIAKEDYINEKCDVQKMFATAVFTVDEELHLPKYTYIRLSGFHSACDLSLNGVFVGKIDSGCSRLLFNLTEIIIKGENTLTFEFSSISEDCGLFSSVEILRFNNSIIDDVRIIEERTDESVVLNVDISSVGSSESSRGVATLISSAGQIYYGGFADGRATIHISEPLLWYPQGVGVQNIYKLTVNLYGESDVEDSLEFRIGLCKITASNDALFSVNGLAFLPMGAVYVPEKIYSPEVSRKRTAAFVTSAAMSGFNTFVIRGERLPESAFFDLCDVHGIAVICELSDLSDESLRSIAFLSHHPSFVYLDIIGAEDQKEAEIKIKELIPGIDFSFASQASKYFGEPSIPSDRLTYSVIKPEDRNVFSAEMEKHSGGLCRSMAAVVSEKYLYAWSLSDFAYLSRLSQAENTKREILRCREAFGKSGRAVFSEISSQRLISASSLDRDAGWKALQYYAKDFFAPVTVTAKTDLTSVSFIAVNNRPVAVFGLLEYRILDNENNVLYKYSEEIDIAESSSQTLFTNNLFEYIYSHENDRYVEYTFTEGNSVLAKETVLFTLPKYFDYKNPEIKAEISGADRRFSITLSAEAYAGCVELSFAEVDAVFSENYFDITSKVPVKITFTVNSPVETVKSLKKQLKIKSLYDIGRI